MQIPLRLLTDSDEAVDVRVDADPNCTVGDLADALALATGTAPGGTVRTTWPGTPGREPLQRGDRLEDVGPRAGSTAQVCPQDAGDTTDLPPLPSPVVLVGVHGESRRLPYGSTGVGRAVVTVGHEVEIRSGPGCRVRLDGSPVAGRSVVGEGALVVVDDQSWSIHLDGDLHPPARSGPWSDHRSLVGPGFVPASTCPPGSDAATIELPQPPGTVRIPGLPVLTATVPLLMGAILWVLTRSPTAALFVLFSFVFVVAAGFEARREAKADDRFRVAEFATDLDDARGRLDADADAQREALDRTSPPTADILAWLAPPGAIDARVWQRSRDGRRTPATVVRLGEASVPRRTRIARSSGGRRALRRQADELAEEAERIRAGVTIDLACTGGLALVGNGDRPSAVARAITMQLCTSIGPDALAVDVDLSGPRRSQWRWASWLPHSAGPGCAAPITVLITDSDDQQRTRQRAGRLIVWIGASITEAPSDLAAVLDVASGQLRLRDTQHLGGHHGDDEIVVGPIEDLSVDEAEPAARLLCGLRPAGRSTDSADAGAVLADLLARPEVIDDPKVLCRVWDEAPDRHLIAPIGAALGGGVVNLDLREDGPHALIAGTTGSGKSELLRTLLVSLALHHPPDRLGFLLVDYKGGAAFRQIASLPHSIGLVTDLTPSLARRALISLGAEVRRREEWLAEHALDDLRDAGAAAEDRPAAMVIVVDEFATMAREIPDFVDGLVDIAQRGRSLGIHLVLATQRPAGVVTDAIRANTSIRLALRVTDEDDSRDVVDSSAAASLPRERPGRAVIRLGHGHTTTIQAAHTGATRAERERVRVHLLHGRAPVGPSAAGRASTPATAAPGPGDTSAGTDLTVAVDTIRCAAVLSGRQSARRPWAAPLPVHLPLEECEPSGEHVVFGLTDRPDLQCHEALRFDGSQHRGVAVVGPSGTGRSTTLSSFAHALRAADPEAVVYAVSEDPQVGDAVLAGAGDVIRHGDVERVRRMLRLVDAELAQRRSGDTASAGSQAPWLVAIDGFGAFDEIHERVDRGIALESISRIGRDGPSVGIHLLITASRRAEIGPPLSACLGLEVLLGDDAGSSPSSERGIDPGRCLANGRQSRVACPPRSARRWVPGDGVGRVHRSPNAIGRSRLIEHRAASPGPGHVPIPIGVDVDELATVHLDLGHHHGFVVGVPRSGRTTTLVSIAAWADETGRDSVLVGLDTAPDERTAAIVGLLERAAKGSGGLLLLDDLPLLIDGDIDHELEPLLTRALDIGRQHPLRVVATGDATSFISCFSDPVRRMRSGRTGIVLGVSDDAGPDVLHSSTPQRSDVPDTAGRGWLINRGEQVLIQVATA